MPNNRVIEATTPDNSIYIPTYDEGALLNTVDVKLRGSASFTSFVENIEYNARRQREKIVYANGVTTNYEYDEKTFRLTQLLSTTTSQTLQDFNYTYDPMGNITSIMDDATQTIYFSNNAVEPDRDYTYDPLYRLTDATGREHVNQPGNEYDDFPTGINLPHPNDPQSMRTYTRSYTYDKAGNLTELSHAAQNGNWSRSYDIADTSNQLESTTIGQTTVNYTLDNHGNHLDLPNMDSIVWDFRDRMVEADLGGGGMIYFLYDAAGNRIRKVVENTQGKIVKERLYLDGYELYHEFDVNEDIDFERETLHVMDDQVRIAMVETKTIEDGDPITTPTSLIRYELDDHLGTHAIELSDTGALISFEEYYPYGGTSFQSTSSSSQVSQKRYRYNGKEKDEETNLYYYGARYYISWLGRWMNCDPIGEQGSGLNLYRYASDNPIMRVDPTGMADDNFDEHSLNGQSKFEYSSENETQQQMSSSPQSLQPSETDTLLKESEPKTTENRESFGNPLPGENSLRNYQAKSMDPMPEKSLFGPGRSTSQHQGIDIYAPKGTSALSVGEGKVVRAEDSKNGYGNVVTIRVEAVKIDGKYYPAKASDDPKSIESIYVHYAHLDSINVKVDDVVQKGQKIGETGVSGIKQDIYKLETNQHLHFEVRTQERPGTGMSGRIDPKQVIDVKTMKSSVEPGLLTTINQRMYSR